MVGVVSVDEVPVTGSVIATVVTVSMVKSAPSIALRPPAITLATTV